MGDILSQNEIDELLRSISGDNTGELTLVPDVSVKEAKNYDFERPSKFSKEQLRTIELIFENYARMVSSFLTGYLRTSSHIEVAAAEQMPYNDFNNSLINPVILGIVDFHPLKGSLMVELSSNIGYSIIDRILGGPGLSLKKIRDFSEIEKILLERVITQMLSYMPEPWENVIELRPRLDKIETNSQFAQIISPNDIVALVTLNIKVGSSEGLMNFCIPYLVIEPIMEKLNTKYWFTQPEEDDKAIYKSKIELELEKTMIPITGVVGKTNITVNEFISLQAGDIITLDSYINSDLNVMIGNLLKFQGKPGVSRGRNAIQITSLLGKEE